MDNVLLIGANDGACWSVARSYYRAGLSVTVLDWQDHPIRWSRFVRDCETITSPFVSLVRAVEDCVQVVARRLDHWIVPINDAAIEILRCAGSRIPPERILGWNLDQAYRHAHDKQALLEKCAELGLAVPRSVLCRNLEEVRAAGLAFPVIAKPSSSCVAAHDRLLSFHVTRAENLDELLDTAAETLPFVPLLVQEWLPGFGVGFNLLARHGELVDYYCHRRLAEGNNSGSTLRETCPVGAYFDLGQIRSLVRSVGWHGVAMLEFRVAAGIPYIMEMNGRFWGSLELGVSAGVDLATELYRMEVAGAMPVPRPYGRMAVRNLRGDLLLALSRLRRTRELGHFAQWVAVLLWGFLRPGHRVEDRLSEDVAYRLRYWGAVPMLVWRRLCDGWRLRRVQHRTLPGPVGPNQTVAFICYGNICRSPFAERYAGQWTRLATFQSFGFHDLESRSSPPTAVEIARQFGVELGPHRSRRLRDSDLEKIDLFVVMDRRNFIQLTTEFPEIPRERIYFLPEEIADPYRRPRSVFQQTYAQIAEGIEKLWPRGGEFATGTPALRQLTPAV